MSDRSQITPFSQPSSLASSSRSIRSSQRRHPHPLNIHVSEHVAAADRPINIYVGSNQQVISRRASTRSLISMSTDRETLLSDVLTRNNIGGARSPPLPSSPRIEEVVEESVELQPQSNAEELIMSRGMLTPNVVATPSVSSPSKGVVGNEPLPPAVTSDTPPAPAADVTPEPQSLLPEEILSKSIDDPTTNDLAKHEKSNGDFAIGGEQDLQRPRLDPIEEEKNKNLFSDIKRVLSKESAYIKIATENSKAFGGGKYYDPQARAVTAEVLQARDVAHSAACTFQRLLNIQHNDPMCLACRSATEASSRKETPAHEPSDAVPPPAAAVEAVTGIALVEVSNERTVIDLVAPVELTMRPDTPSIAVASVVRDPVPEPAAETQKADIVTATTSPKVPSRAASVSQDPTPGSEPSAQDLNARAASLKAPSKAASVTEDPASGTTLPAQALDDAPITASSKVPSRAASVADDRASNSKPQVKDKADPKQYSYVRAASPCVSDWEDLPAKYQAPAIREDEPTPTAPKVPSSIASSSKKAIPDGKFPCDGHPYGRGPLSNKISVSAKPPSVAKPEPVKSTPTRKFPCDGHPYGLGRWPDSPPDPPGFVPEAFTVKRREVMAAQDLAMGYPASSSRATANQARASDDEDIVQVTRAHLVEGTAPEAPPLSADSGPSAGTFHSTNKKFASDASDSKPPAATSTTTSDVARGKPIPRPESQNSVHAPIEYLPVPPAASGVSERRTSSGQRSTTSRSPRPDPGVSQGQPTGEHHKAGNTAGTEDAVVPEGAQIRQTEEEIDKGVRMLRRALVQISTGEASGADSELSREMHCSSPSPSGRNSIGGNDASGASPNDMAFNILHSDLLSTPDIAGAIERDVMRADTSRSGAGNKGGKNCSNTQEMPRGNGTEQPAIPQDSKDPVLSPGLAPPVTPPASPIQEQREGSKQGTTTPERPWSGSSASARQAVEADSRSASLRRTDFLNLPPNATKAQIERAQEEKMRPVRERYHATEEPAVHPDPKDQHVSPERATSLTPGASSTHGEAESCSVRSSTSQSHGHHCCTSHQRHSAEDMARFSRRRRREALDLPMDATDAQVEEAREERRQALRENYHHLINDDEDRAGAKSGTPHSTRLTIEKMSASDQTVNQRAVRQITTPSEVSRSAPAEGKRPVGRDGPAAEASRPVHCDEREVLTNTEEKAKIGLIVTEERAGKTTPVQSLIVTPTANPILSAPRTRVRSASRHSHTVASSDTQKSTTKKSEQRAKATAEAPEPMGLADGYYHPSPSSSTTGASAKKSTVPKKGSVRTARSTTASSTARPINHLKSGGHASVSVPVIKLSSPEPTITTAGNKTVVTNATNRDRCGDEKRLSPPSTHLSGSSKGDRERAGPPPSHSSSSSSESSSHHSADPRSRGIGRPCRHHRHRSDRPDGHVGNVNITINYKPVFNGGSVTNNYGDQPGASGSSSRHGY